MEDWKRGKLTLWIILQHVYRAFCVSSNDIQISTIGKEVGGDDFDLVG